MHRRPWCDTLNVFTNCLLILQANSTCLAAWIKKVTGRSVVGQVALTEEAYMYCGLCNIKWLEECFYLPWMDRYLWYQVCTQLYTCVDRGTLGVKCLAQERNTITPARARTRSTRTGFRRANHYLSHYASTCETTERILFINDVLHLFVSNAWGK